MNEERQAAILIGMVALIGFGGLYITGGIPFLEEPFPAGFFLGDAYVESYQADLYLNGTLSEEFDYRIKKSGVYRMLYRNWKMPLSAEHLQVPYIEPLEILTTPGAVPYVKDNNGVVQILSAADSRYNSEVATLAERNEAGGYYPQRFSAGQYRMEYLFRIHPYLECDQEFCHWNLMLANEHLPYRQLAIRIHDPDDQIVELFTHPKMRIQKERKTWVITGGSPKNELIEVEMLFVPQAANAIVGFPRVVPNVYQKTISAQEKDGTGLLLLLRSLVAALPLLLILIYLLYGTEKRFTVPRVLSTPPSKRRPWQVNMLFKGDACDFDPDGFYATLLDLHNRDIIRIDTSSGTRIMLLDPSAPDLDQYERKVIYFLQENSRGGVFSAPAFEAKVESLAKSINREELDWLRSRMDGILHYANDDVVRQHLTGRSIRTLGIRIQAKHLLQPLIWVAFLIIIFNMGSGILENTLALTTMVLLLQSSLAAFAPSALFGRWKEDYYKEKLEWDAFRTFLGDFAMIQRYSPQELNMWKEWLIYGTALGVGDKVEKALKDLNITIPEAVAIHTIHTSFSHAYSASAPRSSSSGGFGGGSGGGFGSGGGGGGGGGGAR